MSEPVLELDGVTDAAGGHFTLSVGPGQLALIQADDHSLISRFSEICLGLIQPITGTARLLGREWRGMPPEAARALRVRVGVVSLGGGWAPHLSVADSVILAALTHRVATADALRDRAAELCRRFGLPGLPLQRPAGLSTGELARASCARAFLTQPALLILESPLQGNTIPELRALLLEALADAQPAACLWLTTSPSVWADRAMPAAHRHRLGNAGLQDARRLPA